MSQRAKKLAERIRDFNEEVMAIVRNSSREDWEKVCPSEDWTVGVVARHIGAGHYGAISLAKMIIAGEKLPNLSREEIIKMANDHAREHAGCTREEVLGILQDEGDALMRFVSGLTDQEFDRKGYLHLLERDITAEEFIKAVILGSGGEHLASIKETVHS